MEFKFPKFCERIARYIVIFCISLAKFEVDEVDIKGVPMYLNHLVLLAA